MSFARSVLEIVICCIGDNEHGDGVYVVPACSAVGCGVEVDPALGSGSNVTLPFGREVGAMIV
jgi:hypothetical protein